MACKKKKWTNLYAEILMNRFLVIIHNVSEETKKWWCQRLGLCQSGIVGPSLTMVLLMHTSRDLHQDDTHRDGSQGTFIWRTNNA